MSTHREKAGELVSKYARFIRGNRTDTYVVNYNGKLYREESPEALADKVASVMQSGGWADKHPREMNAVNRVLDGGQKIATVARDFGVSPSTIRRWMDRSQGIES